MVNLSISLKEESYDKIRDIEAGSGKSKQDIIRQLIQYGFAYIEKENLEREIEKRTL